MKRQSVKRNPMKLPAAEFFKLKNDIYSYAEGKIGFGTRGIIDFWDAFAVVMDARDKKQFKSGWSHFYDKLDLNDANIETALRAIMNERQPVSRNPRRQSVKRNPRSNEYIVGFDKEFLSGNLKGLTVFGQSITYPTRASAQRAYKFYFDALRNRKPISDTGTGDKFIPRNIMIVPLDSEGNPRYVTRAKKNPRLGSHKRIKKTRARRNPIGKFIIEAMQENNIPMYYQLGSKGVSKPLQGLFTTTKSKGSHLNSYNAHTTARHIVPYLDKRLKWIKVIPA